MNRTYTTKRLILRTLTPAEADLALAYYEANKEFLAPYEPSRDESFYTIDHHQNLLTVEQTEMDLQRMLRLWLFLKDGSYQRPVGNFAFTNIVRGVFLNCFLGYKMDGQFLKQGYMSEALTKGIDVIFNEFGLHRIEANIMPKNTPSLALAKSLGFTEEGIAKKYLRINDIWEDHIHMVKFNEALE